MIETFHTNAYFFSYTGYKDIEKKLSVIWNWTHSFESEKEHIKTKQESKLNNDMTYIEWMKLN